MLSKIITTTAGKAHCVSCTQRVALEVCQKFESTKNNTAIGKVIDMIFFDYLVETYGYNEVIVAKELSFKNYSVAWIKKAISELCKENKLVRFEKGIYYIPTDTPLGKSKLDSKKVIVKKYINDGMGEIGYFSGLTFMNMLGLSTQVPNVLEVYTNNEVSCVREVLVDKQRVILRRSRCNVNSANVVTMSFLELMNFTDASFFDSPKKKIITEYIKDNKITRQAVSKYSPYFPDKAMRTLVESEIIYDVAQ